MQGRRPMGTYPLCSGCSSWSSSWHGIGDPFDLTSGRTASGISAIPQIGITSAFFTSWRGVMISTTSTMSVLHGTSEDEVLTGR